MIITEAILKNQDGKSYSVMQSFNSWDFNDQDDLRHVETIWTEGNYSCDCNRGYFISQVKNEPDPMLPCGETIILVSLIAINEERTRQILLYQKPLDVGDLKDWTMNGVLLVPAHEMPRWEV